MLEQRRHQRIRFGNTPLVRVGYAGKVYEGRIENLSLFGLMARSPVPFEIGRNVGCEFRIPGAQLIDIPATVVSRVGDLFGVRFLHGPLSQMLIDDAISSSLNSGKAAILSVHELAGRKVMRIIGGLNGGLRADFMHALTSVGIDEIELSGVTHVEQAGIALCMVAKSRYGVLLGEQSAIFAEAWNLAMAAPGGLEKNDDWGTDTQVLPAG